MSYSQQNLDFWLTANTGVIVTGGALDPIVTGNLLIRPGYQPVQVSAIYALVVTTVTVAAATLTFNYRPTIGSATGAFTIGTLTFPIGAAAGTIYYKKVDSLRCPPGGEFTLATNGAATAGAVQPGIFVNPTWDAPGNNTKMIASA